MSRITSVLALGLVVCAAVTSAAAVRTPRALNHDQWIVPSDRPSDAAASRGGTVEFRIDINEQGKPTNCVITVSSGVESLDQATCRAIMRRALFSPASVDGKRRPGTYYDKVQWVPLGKSGMPYGLHVRRSVIEFDINDRGEIVNCRVEGSTDPGRERVLPPV